jgi:hypothetical protein
MVSSECDYRRRINRVCVVSSRVCICVVDIVIPAVPLIFLRHFNVQALALPTTLHTNSPPAPPRTHTPAARAPSPANAGAAKEEYTLAKNHFTTRPTQFAAGEGKEEDACSQPSVLFESGLVQTLSTSTHFTTQFPGRRAESRALASGLLLASDLGLENAPFRQNPDTWRRSVAMWQERFQLPLRLVY